MGGWQLRFTVVLLLVGMGLLGATQSWGAADTAEDYSDLYADMDTQEETMADPLEPVNRGVFWLNDKLYFYLFKPVARAYRVVPRPVRRNVDNVFENAATPVRVGNCLLQGKLRGALHETVAFVFNSTFGLAGMHDIMQGSGLQRRDEDFGQTLGHFGVGQGMYLVLPVLGPSSLRDAAGRFVDGYADPWSYVEPWEVYPAAKALEFETWLSLDRDSYEEMKEDALDPYLYLRSSYRQRRQAEVQR